MSTPSKVAWAALIPLCVIAAAAAIRRIVVLSLGKVSASPPQMAALDSAFSSRAALTLAHIIPALFFVVLLPLWFSRRVRSRAGAHRKITQALLTLGVVVGLSAFPLSVRPIGGLNEAAAAIFYDCLFLFSLSRAWLLFRRNDVALHRTWMVRAIAVLLGIAMTRPVMGIFFATESITHLQPQQFFGTAFWLGFTIMYVAGETYLRLVP